MSLPTTTSGTKLHVRCAFQNAAENRRRIFRVARATATGAAARQGVLK